MKPRKKLTTLLEEANELHKEFEGLLKPEDISDCIALSYNYETLRLAQIAQRSAEIAGVQKLKKNMVGYNWWLRRANNIGNMGIAYQQAYKIVLGNK